MVRNTKVEEVVSPKFSFRGWSFYKFIEGRDRLLLAVIGGGLGFFITDSVVIGTISAAAVEIIYALAKYFYKEQK